MISTSVHLRAASFLELSTRPLSHFPKVVQETLAKIVNLIRECWRAVMECTKGLGLNSKKSSLEQRGESIIDEQVSYQSLDKALHPLRFVFTRVVTSITFQGEIVGLRCSNINRLTQETFENHSRKVKEELRCSLVNRKVDAWSPLTISSFFLELPDSKNNRGIIYRSAQLRAQNECNLPSSLAHFADLSEEQSIHLIDRILTETRKDPQKYGEKIKRYFFEKA